MLRQAQHRFLHRPFPVGFAGYGFFDTLRQAQRTAFPQSIDIPLPQKVLPFSYCYCPFFRADQLAWLAQGWEILKPLQDIAAQLPEYRDYHDADSRRSFLNHLISQLEALDGGLRRADGGEQQAEEADARLTHPTFWRAVAQELAAHWIELLKKEAANAREWLQISVDIPPQTLQTGHHALLIEVRNDSGVAARKLELRLTDVMEGLRFDTARISLNKPLERFQEDSFSPAFICETPGTYALSGEIIAEDLSGIPGRRRFPRAREVLWQQLEDLCEQGLLENAGASSYRFAVPLFRRWLAWRWPPEKVRLASEGV